MIYSANNVPASTPSADATMSAAEAILGKASICREKSEFKEAEAYCTAALKSYQDLDDEVGPVDSWQLFGETCRLKEDLAESMSHYRKAHKQANAVHYVMENRKTWPYPS